MAKNTVTYYIEIDAEGTVTGSKKAIGSFDDIDQKADQSGKKITAFSEVSKTAMLGFAAATGTSLVMIGDKAIEVGGEFEEMQDELSAITGLVGGDLDYLGDEAINMSVQYGTAASNVVEAQKLVASKLADKIDFNSEGAEKRLNTLTEKTIVLQKAAGVDLPTAVSAVSKSLNQFQEDISETDRFVNVLAAGAKYGASEVAETSEAIKNSGVDAKNAGLSFEDLNAAIQIMAANGKEGSEAGTGLGTTFTRLQTKSEELAKYGIENVDIRTNGLTKTLKQLQPIMDDTTALNAIFGEEAQDVASILISNASAVESMTQKLTGTNTAYEQANTRMDNYRAATDRLSQALTGKLIGGFESVAPYLTDTIDWTTDLIHPTNELSDEYLKLESKVNNLSSTLPGLLSEYETLESNADKSAVEQDRLKTVIEELKGILPASVIQFNKYGEAIGLNTEAAREYRKQQEEILKLENRDAFEEQVKGMQEYVSKLGSAQEQLKAFQETGEGLGGAAAYDTIDEARDAVEDYRVKVNQALSNIERLGFSTDQTAEITAKLFGIDVGTYTYDLSRAAELSGFLTEKTAKAGDQAETTARSFEEIAQALNVSGESSFNLTVTGTEQSQQSVRDLISEIESLESERSALLSQEKQLTESEQKRVEVITNQITVTEERITQTVASSNAEETLTNQITNLTEKRNDLINQSGEMTASEAEEIVELNKKIETIKQLQEALRKLQEETGKRRPDIPVEMPEDVMIDDPVQDLGFEIPISPVIMEGTIMAVEEQVREMENRLLTITDEGERNRLGSQIRNSKARLAALKDTGEAQIKITQQALSAVSTGFGEMFGQIVAGGEDFGKTFLKILFDVLDSMIPLLTAQIMAISLAQLDSIMTFGAAGFARAAIITGLLKGAVAGARSAVGLAEGGEVEGEEKNLVPVNVSRDEVAIEPEKAKKNRSTIHEINSSPAKAKEINEQYKKVYLSSKTVTESVLRTIRGAQDERKPIQGSGKIQGPGTRRSDSIKTALPAGSFVINAQSAEEAPDILSAIINGVAKFATGGAVQPIMVSNGEASFTPETATKYKPILEMINADPGMAKELNNQFISGPGTGTSDSIPATAKTGSYIVNAESTGNAKQLLSAMMANRFAQGGNVGRGGATNVSVKQDMSAVAEIRETLNQLTGVLDNIQQSGIMAVVDKYDAYEGIQDVSRREAARNG